MENKSLIEKINDIEAKLEDKDKDKNKKEWKLPFKFTMIGQKKKKEGWILLQHLSYNGATSFEKVQVDEGVAMGKDMIPHVVTAEDIFLYKNKLPMVIIPDWSKYPIRKGELYSQTLATKGAGTMGWEFLMNYMYKTQIKEKKKATTGVMIIGVLVLIGLGYYLVKSGALS